MEAAFKSISMKQVEEAFAIALSALTCSEARVAIKVTRDVSDGADNVIGQERWEVGLVATVVKRD
jgi:hypothetical protein